MRLPAAWDVPFSVTRKDASTYSVMVSGFGGSFTVVVPALVVPPMEEEVPEAPAPVPTTPTIILPLIGRIIAGVIVVGLLIFFLPRQRRSHKDG